MLKWNRHWQCMIYADMTEEREHMILCFTAVPIYHGNDEDFDEWADQLEALCEISH